MPLTSILPIDYANSSNLELPTRLDKFCKKFNLENLLTKSDKTQLKNFLSVLKMHKLGKSCIKCHNPNPNRYHKRIGLCDKCSYYQKKSNRKILNSVPHMDNRKCPLTHPKRDQSIKKIFDYIFFMNLSAILTQKDANSSEPSIINTSTDEINNSEFIDNQGNINSDTLNTSNELSTKFDEGNPYKDKTDDYNPIKNDGFLNIDF